MHPPQGLDRLAHDTLTHTERFHPILCHALQLARLSDERARFVGGSELVHAQDFEAAVGVHAAGVGAGADGEDGLFADFEVGGGDAEDEFVLCGCGSHVGEDWGGMEVKEGMVDVGRDEIR